MYIKKDKQISLFDFGQEAGLQLNPNNRWVRLREMIDWDAIEEKYSKLYCRNNGRRAKLIQMGIGALLIKQMQGFSDEEVVLHLQENPYMQYFCGIESYKDEKPFVSQMMSEFRKRFNEKVIQEINDAMFRKLAQEESQKDKDNDDGENSPKNKGTLILDATCAPASIAYPQDIKLCNEAREKTEEMIEVMHKANKGKVVKPRLDKKKARASYLKIAKNKQLRGKKLRQSIKTQLSYIRRNIIYIER